MQSMTGYAIKTLLLVAKDSTQTHITLSLKSLNSRYFEVNCKLPVALQFFETELVKLFKKKLHRGTITFSIQTSNPNIFKGSVLPDLMLTKSYVRAIDAIKKETNLSGDITIADLINLPNVFIIEETILDEGLKNEISKYINDLVDQLITERAAEGAVLLKDIELRIAVIQPAIKQIEESAETLMQTRKQEINKQLSTLTKERSELVDAQRAALYFELDKIDIHEEIIRFQNHLKNFSTQLHGKETEKGRRLDFICQELSREINTIAAKCADSNISALAINVKVELEKIREQIQNVV